MCNFLYILITESFETSLNLIRSHVGAISSRSNETFNAFAWTNHILEPINNMFIKFILMPATLFFFYIHLYYRCSATASLTSFLLNDQQRDQFSRCLDNVYCNRDARHSLCLFVSFISFTCNQRILFKPFYCF